MALDLLGESVPSIPMEGDCGAAAAPVLRGSAPQKRRKKRKYKQVQLSQLDSEGDYYTPNANVRLIQHIHSNCATAIHRFQVVSVHKLFRSAMSEA